MRMISMISGTLTGNRGAEAMLSTVIGRIRERFPDTLFNIYSYYPRDDRKTLIDPDIRIFSSTPASLVFALFPLSLLAKLLFSMKFHLLLERLPASITRLVKSDALIDISGVSFIDGREKFLPFNVLTVLPGIILNVPVFKFSQALGPFHNDVNRFVAFKILTRCKKIFARGDISFRNLREIGIPEDIYAQAADIAFVHKKEYSLTNDNPDYVDHLKSALQKKKEKNLSIVGICPSAVVEEKARGKGFDYIELLANLIERLIKRDIDVILFPNATREKHPRNTRNNDLPVIKRIVERLAYDALKRDHVQWVTRDINTVSIKDIIKYCDILIVSRFHAMIASLTLCVPFMVIGWSHKYIEVMQQFRLENWVFDYTISIENGLYTKLISLMDQKDQVKGIIRSHLKEADNSSMTQFDILFSFLYGNKT